jgi:polyketide cyclase/dehydrase/lipid transport protein
MWAHEQSIETGARPEQIWRLWANVAEWPEWNGDIERIALVGPFAAGGTILMTPFGDEPIELHITEAVEPELFVDEADMGEILIRTIHRVEPIDSDRARITYRMEITGPGADTLGPQVGPEISDDFPQILAGLATRAADTERTDSREHAPGEAK